MNPSSQSEVLALIPARGGSKGLPRKNILPLGGKPMIAHAIGAALNSALVTNTVVSSDCDEIMAVANDSGARVPFKRPDELATDVVGIFPVIVHALNWLEEHEDYRPDLVALIQANSPFVTSSIIDACIRLLIESNADVVYTLSKLEHPPHWAQRLDSAGIPRFLLPSAAVPKGTRRQDMPPVYRPTGTVSVIRTAYLRHCERQSVIPGFNLPIENQQTRAVVIDPIVALDIDTALDYALAKSLLEKGACHEVHDL